MALCVLGGRVERGGQLEPLVVDFLLAPLPGLRRGLREDAERRMSLGSLRETMPLGNDPLLEGVLCRSVLVAQADAAG